MSKLDNWDFLSSVLNETGQQINRQKSALNQKLLELDKEARTAVFWDERYNIHISTSLESCSCHDFNFAGTGKRKRFFPCKHIYRLCFELEILTPKYFDAQTQWKMWKEKTPEERQRIALHEMHSYGSDPNAWGRWNERIHHNYYQIARQHRAYGLVDELPEMLVNAEQCEIHGYAVTLTSCTCPDFSERKLPCKHIYCLAIMRGHSIAVSRSEYIQQAAYEREWTRAIWGGLFSLGAAGPQRSTRSDQANGSGKPRLPGPCGDPATIEAVGDPLERRDTR